MRSAEADFAECRRLLCAGSRTFYLASFLLPAAVRDPAIALYAFCRVADDDIDCDGGALQLARLEQRLAAVYAGNPMPHAVDRAFARVVDDFALVLSGLFLVAGYLTILLSTNYIAEGDYAEGEYYLMLLSAVFGMVVMASARDLISIFIALEMLSIPAYLMAGWRKRTLTGNEAGMKYYLMGVFASAVMLYGMSLLYGASGTTLFTGSVQIARPIFADRPEFLWALFVDAGNASDGWKDMRPVLGYGAGLHWRSPVGPLRVDLAYGEEVRQFRLHFSVGVVF